jgi:hypothetical protein
MVGHTWTPVHRRGRAVYAFDPRGQFQVPLVDGVEVDVKEEYAGWYRGIVLTDPPVEGLFPAAYIELEPEQPPAAAFVVEDRKASSSTRSTAHPIS